MLKGDSSVPGHGLRGKFQYAIEYRLTGDQNEHEIVFSPNSRAMPLVLRHRHAAIATEQPVR